MPIARRENTHVRNTHVRNTHVRTTHVRNTHVRNTHVRNTHVWKYVCREICVSGNLYRKYALDVGSHTLHAGQMR